MRRSLGGFVSRAIGHKNITIRCVTQKACTWPIYRTVLILKTGAGDGITFDQNANAVRDQSGRRGGPPKAVIKEVVGIHVLLTRSLFGCGILRRLLLRVSASETDFCSFAILMASLKRSLNLGLVSTHSREKHTAEPVQFGTPIALLRSFEPVLPPRLLPQELRRYDPQGAKLQPLVLG